MNRSTILPAILFPHFFTKALRAILAVAAVASVQAQTTYVWQRTSGTNSWNTAGNWLPATVAAGVGNTADYSGFDFTTIMGVTLDGSRTIGHLRFGDTGVFKNNWNLLSGSGGTLTLGVSSGSPTIAVNVTNAAIFPSISSSVGLVKIGNSAGVLDLRAANTLSGTVAVSNGVLQIRNGGGLGTNSSVVVNWDAGVVGGTGTRVQLENVNIPAGVGITLTSSNQSGTSRRSSLYANSGTNVWNGPITISGDDLTQIYAINSGVRLTLNGTITGSSGLVFIRGGNGTGIIAGNVNIGNTSVNKTDSGTWIINSVNNVWGPTAVADGTLRLGANNALPITTALTLGQGSATTGTFDLGGFDQEVAGLNVFATSTSPSHSIGNSSTTSDSILTFNGAIPSTFRGLIRNTLGSGNRRVSLNLVGGQLTLATNNTFTGRTLITGGTLALSSFGGLASTNIVVNAANGFDVSANSFVVASNQVLSGTGSVNGLVTVGTAGYASPGGAGVANTLTFNNGLVCNDRSFLNFDLANVATEGGSINDLIMVNGDLTINGSVRCALNTLSGSFASPGTYVLIRYTGSLIENGSFAASGPRYTYTFDTTTPGEVRLTISGTAIPANLLWFGDCLTDIWETAGPVGLWQDANPPNSPEAFYQQDNVTLDDNAFCFEPIINLSGVLQPGSVRVNTDFKYTLIGSGILDGTMNLTKDATGVLVISNANTYTGTNFLNGGTTVPGNPTALGSAAGPTIIASGATLDLNGQNLGAEPILAGGSGFIGLGGALVNNGPDQQSALRNVTLTAATTFGGANRWDMRSAVAGDPVLQANGFNVTKNGPNTVYMVNNQSNLVDSGLGNVEVAQGTFGAAFNITLGNPANTLTLQDGAAFQITSTGTNRLEKALVMGNDARFEIRGGINAFAGPVTLNGNAIFDHASGTSVRLDGNVGGATGYLIKTTNIGTLQLAGTNSFTNPINVYGGALAANSDSAFGSAAVINVNANPFASAAGTGSSLQLNNVNTPAGVELNLNTSVPNFRASLVSSTGTNVWNGPVICSGGAPAGLYATTPLTLNGNVLASEPAYTSGGVFFRGGSVGTLNGVVNLGTNNFFKTDGGAWVVNSAGHQWGLSLVADGTLRLGGNDVLPTPTPMRLGQAGATTGRFDLAGYNQTISGLDIDPATTSFAHEVGNSSTNADSRLTIAGPGASLFGGIIRDILGTGTRKVGLTVSGGTFILTNDHLYSDSTLIAPGATLQLGNATARGSAGSSSIDNAGTLAINRSTAATVTNLISGAGTIVNNGAGTLVLAGANTHSGPTLANSGKTVLTTAKLGAGGVTMADGATLGVKVLAQGAKVTAANAAFGTAAGAALEVDMGLLGNLTGPALDVPGTITVTGPLTVNIVAANSLLTSGRFPLVRYGTLDLTAGSLVLGALPPRVAATIEDNPGNQTIDLVISSTDSIRWSGSAGADWDINNSFNWLTLIGAAAATYQQPGALGETVLFDDNLSANPGVNLTTTLSPLLLTVSNQSASYAFTGSGKVSGATTVVKDGVASLTVATANDYTGPTQIKAGTVILSNNAALGATAGGTVISDGATLDSNTRSPGLEPIVVSGAGVGGLGAIINSSSTNTDAISDFRDISLAGHTTFGGSGRWDLRASAATDPGLRGHGYNLTKVGVGTVAIVGPSAARWNTAVADVDITAGALAFEQNSSLGLPAATLTVRSNAALQLFNTGPTNPLDKVFVLEDRSTFRSTGPGTDPRATNVCVGPISGSGVPILDVGNLSTLYLFSVLSGSGGLDRVGTGNLFVQGSNYLAGTLTLQNGVTYLDSTNSPSVVVSNVLISASGGSARLILNRDEQLADATLVTLASTAANQSRFIPNGHTETIAGLAGNQGAQPRIVEAAFDNVEDTSSSLLIHSPTSVTNDFNGFVRNAAGTTNSRLSITKSGPGVQVFSGPANQVSYSGDTTINDGILAVSGTASVLNTSRINLGGGTIAFLGGGTRTNAIDGTGNVAVEGASTLTLAGTHTYQGSTLVRAGTLLVSGVIGTGSGNVVVEGGSGTLSGTGLINDPVTVQAGGTLAPGTSIGTLTVNNTLSLAGTNVMEINKSGATLTADKVAGISALTYGGTLTVAASGDALSAGDTFDLFDAATFSGVFSTFNLPALSGGLSWDTSSLTTDGTIKVIGAAPSLSIRLDPGSLTLEWPPTAGYFLQSQTNAIGAGLRTNAMDWINWPGAPNPLIIAPVPTNENVFFRLIKP